MKHLILLALLPLLLATSACAQTTASDDDRAERILANLRFEFPQLASTTLTMNDIVPSGVDGFDRGTFVINGQQEQAFLISRDDRQLYLIIGDAIDASRDAAGLAAAETERQSEADRAARDRAVELNEALANLPSRGNPDAPITIVEFSDFQCSFCARAHGTLERVLAANDDVRLVYVQYPLPNHAWGQTAALAALCTQQQSADAFWTLHDYYFANQGGLNPSNVLDRSRAVVAGAGVDVEEWNTCVTTPTDAAHVAARLELEKGMALANELGVTGTPAFFINGRFLNGAQPPEVFNALIDAIRTEG